VIDAPKPPRAYLKRNPEACTRVCHNKALGEMTFHLKVKDGSISHYLCTACKGLTLVATGSQVVKQALKVEAPKQPKRLPKHPDPETADLTDLTQWLEAQCISLQKQARTDPEAYQTIAAIQMVLAGRKGVATASEGMAWDVEVREAARALLG
jgi:hypothetical protein